MHRKTRFWMLSCISWYHILVLDIVSELMAAGIYIIHRKPRLCSLPSPFHYTGKTIQSKQTYLFFFLIHFFQYTRIICYIHCNDLGTNLSKCLWRFFFLRSNITFVLTRLWKSTISLFLVFVQVKQSLPFWAACRVGRLQVCFDFVSKISYYFFQSVSQILTVFGEPPERRTIFVSPGMKM